MRVLYLTFFVVIADQVSKLLVKGFSIPFLNIYHKGMELSSSHYIIDNWISITYVENPGMAFGLEFGGKVFFAIFSIIASLGILFYLYKVKHEKLYLRIPLAFILGGAIGNLIDRVFYGVFYNEASLFYGKVVDFIYLPFVKFDIFGIRLNGWPIFNIADISVSIGVVLLIIFHNKITETIEDKAETISVKDSGIMEQNNITEAGLSSNEGAK